MSAPHDLLAMLEGLSLRSPWLLALALLIPLALAVRRARGRPAIPLATVALGPEGTIAPRGGAAASWPRSWRARLLPLPRALAALGLLLAVVALARPVRRERLPLHAEGIDVLLCLDVSSSMRSDEMGAADERPAPAPVSRPRTRLDAAREAAAEFVRARPFDRIGLLTFARYPDVLCPLTLDHASLLAMLASVDLVPSDGPEDATGIGTAVARAAQALTGAEASTGGRPRTRLVILLTDGEENVATRDAPGEIAPAHAAQLCERLGVRVDAIAVGAGSRTRTGGWQPLDTRAVASLAKRTGGSFFEARDAAATAQAYARIDALEKTVFDAPRAEDVDAFLPFLAAALSLLLVAWLLEATVLGALP